MPGEVRRDRQRWRVQLHPLLEAAGRVGLAYLRDQHGFRRRRPLPRFIARNAYFLAAARSRPVLEARLGSASVVVSTSDRTLARSVFASGDWDPLLVGTVFKALDRLGADYRGRTFVEVGANFGVYCLPAVLELGFARAVAYEPEPEAFRLLAANIARNGLGDRVAALQVALSAQPGEVLLSRARNNAGDNRVLPVGDGPARRRGGVVVRASTFDEQVQRGAIPLHDVGLVWLDVQGHEADVLAGARTLLRSSVPLVLEYSSSMMTSAGRAELDRLVTSHYSLLVDLGWSALTNRIRYQPATAITELAPPGCSLETDLLVL